MGLKTLLLGTSDDNDDEIDKNGVVDKETRETTLKKKLTRKHYTIHLSNGQTIEVEADNLSKTGRTYTFYDVDDANVRMINKTEPKITLDTTKKLEVTQGSIEAIREEPLEDIVFESEPITYEYKKILVEYSEQPNSYEYFASMITEDPEVTMWVDPA